MAEPSRAEPSADLRLPRQISEVSGMSAGLESDVPVERSSMPLPRRISEVSSIASSHGIAQGVGSSGEPDVEQIELLWIPIANKIANMEILNPEVVRVTPAFRAFQKRAMALRSGYDGDLGDLYFQSETSLKIDTFWSHSWHGGHWKKITTLIIIYNGPAAVVVGMLIAVAMDVLFSFDALPKLDRGRTDEFHEFEYSCWSLWSGFVVTLLVMILWRPQSRVFLDRICISTDDRLKAQSIFSLAGLLEKSDSMLILWDPTWTERLWCVFELAAFLQSKKDQPKELIIRPTFMGPVQVACFLTAVAGMIPMTMAPMDVASDTWFVVPSSLVFLSASALSYVTMSILRRYFRDLDVMKQQLWSFSFEQVKSSCCDNQHLTPSGARTMCDRRILKECVRMWFGSQKAFENTVCSEVMDILTRDLEQVFTTRSTLAMFVPLMWGFMDIGASEWHIWPGASIAFHIDGLSVWLVFMPMLKDVLVLVGKLTRTRPRSQCLEVLKNLLASFTLTLPALVVMGTYAFSWAIGVIHLADRWPRAWKPVRAGIFFGCMLLYSIFTRCLAVGIKAVCKGT